MKIRANQTIGVARSYTRAGHESVTPCAWRAHPEQSVNFLRKRSTLSHRRESLPTRKALFTSAQSACCHRAVLVAIHAIVLAVPVAATIIVPCLLSTSRATAAQPSAKRREGSPPRRVATPRRGNVRVNVQWSGVPLRRALKGLAESSGEAIVIDRRIDPDQPVSLERQGASPAEIVAAAANELGLAVMNVGPVLYIIPPVKAESIKADLARQMAVARRLKPAQAKVWMRSATLAWPDLAEPRGVLTELAAQEKISLQGAENVPHDLWPAADLPPLPLVERLTLILAPFDLTWQTEDEGRGIAIVPLAEAPAGETSQAKP